MLFLAAMYREVLDTSLLASGPGGWQVGGIVTMETAATGLVSMVTVVGLGWGGRNITEVTDARAEVGPGVKGRAVRFRTLRLGLRLEFRRWSESVIGLGLRLGGELGLEFPWGPF